VKSYGSTEALAFNAANAIATIAFAYGGKIFPILSHEGNGENSGVEEREKK
jgi:hypothetical protein